MCADDRSPEAGGFHQRSLNPAGVRDLMVKPHRSAFKHGTEMMAYSGASPFAARRFNPELRLFEGRPSGDQFYPRPMGSMMVDEVIWTGQDARGFEVGQHVYAWAPIADIHVLPVEKVFPLGELTPDQALCLDPASFALGAVMDGQIARRAGAGHS